MGRGMASVKPMSMVGSEGMGKGSEKENENVGNEQRLAMAVLPKGLVDTLAGTRPPQPMRIFRYVPGSIVVYLVVAACSAAGPATMSSPSDGGGSYGDGSSSGGDGPSLLDALTDPVPSASADTNQSGSRLKVKYYAGADGSKAFAGFYDTQLKADCFFGLAADGATRCIPGTTVPLLGYYTDPGCTQPLLATTAGCGQPTYATKTDTTACTTGATVHAFSVGAPFSGTSVYFLSGTTCTGPSPTTSGVAYFSVGGEVTPASLVAGTLQTEP
jgi:hypothetical protein